MYLVPGDVSIANIEEKYCFTETIQMSDSILTDNNVKKI
jgi:hypothetical protein